MDPTSRPYRRVLRKPICPHTLSRVASDYGSADGAVSCDVQMQAQRHIYFQWNGISTEQSAVFISEALQARTKPMIVVYCDMYSLGWQIMICDEIPDHDFLDPYTKSNECVWIVPNTVEI